MGSRYLIVGATGAIGYAFTRALIESGESVTALVRDKGKALRLFGTTAGLEARMTLSSNSLNMTLLAPSMGASKESFV